MRRLRQLSAIEDQISENLREDRPALPTDSFRASKDANISAWFRILCRMVLGCIVMLFEWALSMNCLVIFVRMMSGWFLGRCRTFSMAVVKEK